MLRTGSSGQSYSNRVFNGAWNTVNSYAVRNGGNPPRGMQLCLSGGKSGTICGLEAFDIDSYASNGHGPGFFFRDADNTRLRHSGWRQRATPCTCPPTVTGR